jgi:hypothetical protein
MNSSIKRFFAASLISLVCSAALLSLCSCSAKARVTGVKNTFIPDVDITSKLPNLPFEHAWVDPQFKDLDYSSIYFKPVRVDLLPKDGWESSASPMVTSEQDYIAKAKEIAAYFHSELLNRTNNIHTKKLTLSTVPGDKTLVIEIALTELEFSHPIARVGAMAAPVPGVGAAVSAVSDPHMAFAARVTDGATGKLIATAADRKFAPTRIIDLNKFTVSSTAREISALWADTITQALQGDKNTKISGKSYDWMPW